MNTTYRIGEICKWSVGNAVEFCYVDIYTQREDKEPLHQVLELPCADALILTNQMIALEYN